MLRVGAASRSEWLRADQAEVRGQPNVDRPLGVFDREREPATASSGENVEGIRAERWTTVQVHEVLTRPEAQRLVLDDPVPRRQAAGAQHADATRLGNRGAMALNGRRRDKRADGRARSPTSARGHPVGMVSAAAAENGGDNQTDRGCTRHVRTEATGAPSDLPGATPTPEVRRRVSGNAGAYSGRLGSNPPLCPCRDAGAPTRSTTPPAQQRSSRCEGRVVLAPHQ